MKRIYMISALISTAFGATQVTAGQSVQQMPARPAGAGMPSSALVSACVDAQQQVAALATQINGRLEDARQTNNPQQMRAALADLQATLVEIRTEAARCSLLEAAAQPAEPHAGHTTPGAAQKHFAPGTPVVQPGSTTPASAAPRPHAGHAMSATKAPSATKPVSRPGDHHADHEPNSLKKAAPAKPVEPTAHMPAQAVTHTGEAAVIEKWLAEYDAAFNAKDLEKLGTFYHPEVTVFEGGGINNGWADYRDRHLGPELKEFQNLQFGHTNRRIHVLGDGRTAYAVSAYSIRAKMGDRDIDSGGLETLVLVKGDDGRWKIRHSHTSARARRPPQ